MTRQKPIKAGRKPRDDEVIGVAANLGPILENCELDVVPTLTELDLILDDGDGAIP